MRKSLKIIFLALLLSLFLNQHYSIFAGYQIEIAKGGGVEREEWQDKEVTLDTSIMSKHFTTDMDPDNVTGDSGKYSSVLIKVIKGIVNPVLGIIQVIGGFLMVVSFAIFGFGLLASGNRGFAQDIGLHISPNSKADLLKYGRSLLIGSALLFSGSSVVLFVFKAVH